MPDMPYNMPDQMGDVNRDGNVYKKVHFFDGDKILLLATAGFF